MEYMKKRGISLVTVSTSVVILILLLSTVSISITYSANNAKKMTFAKEIYNIQSMVTEYIQKENVIPASESTIKIKPSNLEQFEGETLDSGELLLNVLDLTELEIRNTNYGNKEIGANDSEKEKDVYAISQTTGRVYYIAGFKTGEKTYYTLTDELLNIIEKKQQLTIGENTILFIPDKLGWSKEGISVKVAVPSDYTVDSITIDNTNISYTTETIDNVTYYNVNTAKVAANYTITVKYTKNGTSGTASYTTKFDNTVPTISKDSSIANTNTHVKGIKSEDTQSGIKTFKYVEGQIENDANISEYMNTYGKKIRKGIVNFVNKTVYTLYAEDRAGNYKVMYINTNKNLVASIPKPPTLATREKIGDFNLGMVQSVKYIRIVKSYTPTSQDEAGVKIGVDASGNLTGDVMSYYNSYTETLTIAGNGADRIMANEDSSNLFSGDWGSYPLKSVKAISGLDILDTSNVTNMEQMFYYLVDLTSIDVSGFNTKNVTNMNKMFQMCISLSSVDVSGWDTRKVSSYNIIAIFSNCNSLTTIRLGENFGVGMKQYYTAMFHVYNFTIATTVYGANDSMKAYDWSSDGRTVTFVD